MKNKNKTKELADLIVEIDKLAIKKNRNFSDIVEIMLSKVRKQNNLKHESNGT